MSHIVVSGPLVRLPPEPVSVRHHMKTTCYIPSKISIVFRQGDKIGFPTIDPEGNFLSRGTLTTRENVTGTYDQKKRFCILM
jgi:hypothetical protein